jgi:hypothetical protein
MDVKLGHAPYGRTYVEGVLRTISRPKRDEVTGEWRKLHEVNFITNTSLGSTRAII